MQERPIRCWAQGKVRHVGDPSLRIVAETDGGSARDRAEGIAAGLSRNCAVIDHEAAVKEGAPKRDDDLTSNLCYDWRVSSRKTSPTDEGVQDRRRIVTTRGTGQQPSDRQPDGRRAWRWAITTARRTDSTLYYHLAEIRHVIRLHEMGAFVIGHPRAQAARVAPDVGWRFRHKDLSIVFAEEAFAPFAARPVEAVRSNWTCGPGPRASCRTRMAVTSDQDQNLRWTRTTTSMAVPDRTYAEYGAYCPPSTFGARHGCNGTLMAGNLTRTPLSM